MALSIDLITLAELKAFIGLASTITDYDALLATLITKVSARVESFLNRDLKKMARTKYFDAGKRYYFLSAYPIDTDSPLSVTNDTLTLVLNSDYYVWEDIGKIEFYSVPSKVKPKQIKIIWTGGYVSSDTVPEVIKLGMLMQTSFLFRKRESIGVQSITLPDGSVSLTGSFDLLSDVKKQLRTQRRSAG